MAKRQIKMDLMNLMDGAVNERFQQALEQVAANIADPNTEAKKARKIKLIITFKPNEQRNVVETSVGCETILASVEALETTSIMEPDDNGVTALFELGAGLKADQQVLHVASEDQAPVNPKVSNLRAKG